MDVVSLMDDAKKAGVKIELVDGELQIEAKRSQKHWLEKLRPLKPEILAHLNGEPTEFDETAEKGNNVGADSVVAPEMQPDSDWGEV